MSTREYNAHEIVVPLRPDGRRQRRRDLVSMKTKRDQLLDNHHLARLGLQANVPVPSRHRAPSQLQHDYGLQWYKWVLNELTHDSRQCVHGLPELFHTVVDSHCCTLTCIQGARNYTSKHCSRWLRAYTTEWRSTYWLLLHESRLTYSTVVDGRLDTTQSCASQGARFQQTPRAERMSF